MTDSCIRESLRIEQLESAAIQAALSNPPLNKELRLRTLKADPFISKIKPLRVLCVACNGWKNLGGEYALYGWHKHKRIIHGYKNHSSLDGNQERMRLLMEDQLVGEVQAFHVFCKSCGIWLRSRDPHKRYLLEEWREHKAEKHAGRSNRGNVKRQKSYSSDEDILSSDETDSELENSVLDIDNLVDFKHNSGPELNRSSTLVDVNREQAMAQTSGGKRIDGQWPRLKVG